MTIDVGEVQARMSEKTELTALPARLRGRFVLGGLIGRGTSSQVHRAHDTLLDRPAAVRVFPVADDPRARREVRLLAALDHPGLVPVYDVDEVDGRAFVVTALYEGGSLADRLAVGPLELGEALLVVASVADALDHVHRSGVLHRAVKPTNVLFDDDGRAHLSDFGVALVADTPRITDTGDVVGGAGYLAPEQVRGDAVGMPADVYALGLVLVEAVTGRPAFPGEPSTTRADREPERPAGLPGEVEELVTAMTAADPAQRPRAGEVTLGLRRAALATEPRPLAVVPSPRRPMRGRGVIVASGVVMSAVLAGTVVFASTRPVQEISATLPPAAATAAPAPAAPPRAAQDGSSGSGSSDSGSGSSDSGSGSSESSDSGAPLLAEGSSAHGTSGLAGLRGGSASLDQEPASSSAPSTPSSAPTSSTPAPSSSASSTPSPTTSGREEADASDEASERGSNSDSDSDEDKGLLGDLIGRSSGSQHSRDSDHRKHPNSHERHGDGSGRGLLDGVL